VVGCGRARALNYGRIRPWVRWLWPGHGALVQAGLPVLIGLLAGLAVSWLGHPVSPAAPLRLAWGFSPRAYTVTVRVMPAAGTSGRQILAGSHLTVSENGAGRLRRWSDGSEVVVSVPPGERTSLLVQVTGPQPLRRTLTVTAPPPLRVITSRGTLRDARLYCFANPAGRAVYITIDDGWTPSAQVLTMMRRTRLPVTAFLIQRAAQQHLSYWRAFARAGGTIGDHTVSHPNLTTLTLGQATDQWAQARQALGRWFGRAPALGRPPYGAFDRTVEAAAARARLMALAGWSATVSGNRVETWNRRPLRPGEIVVLHWVPELGRQLTTLLATIHAMHLRPAPLTPASFSGIAPQQRPLSGD
jgi:peptidoglycan/xylan/chitin deacetylase (PgdA/CDA1 family)